MFFYTKSECCCVVGHKVYCWTALNMGQIIETYPGCPTKEERVSYQLRGACTRCHCVVEKEELVPNTYGLIEALIDKIRDLQNQVNKPAGIDSAAAIIYKNKGKKK